MRRYRNFELLLLILPGLVTFIILTGDREFRIAQSSGKAVSNDGKRRVAVANRKPELVTLDEGANVASRRYVKTKVGQLAKLDEFPFDQDAEVPIAFKEHVVIAGDTLSEIAEQYETSVLTLVELNALHDPNSLLVGERLIVSAGYSGSGVVEKLLEQGGFVRQTIGLSAGGHPIESFRIGNGQYHVILVGAVHGGYEWNTALLAYRVLTYLSVYPETIPSNITLHVVPTANPDGVFTVTGSTGPFMIDDIADDTAAGRFNGNGVDLNRNWGCDWLAVGQWRDTKVSGGTRPMSEPETRAIRQYIISVNPTVVIWLHSAAGLLVPGNCNGIDHEPSWQAAAMYSSEAGYPVGEFGAYTVTGDAADWLAQHKIASFTVELTDHQNLEFERNLAGLTVLLTGIENLTKE